MIKGDLLRLLLSVVKQRLLKCLGIKLVSALTIYFLLQVCMVYSDRL
jgi:hypothetical protein